MLIHQPTYALNKIQFKTGIKLLHVSAQGCHHQEIIQNKAIQAQHAYLGTVSPLLQLLQHKNSKYTKSISITLQCCGPLQA